MRTLNLKQNHILFGFLLLSLGLSKQWLQTADAEIQYKDLASSNNCIAAADGSMKCKVEYSGQNNKRKSEDIQIKLQSKTVTTITGVEIDPVTNKARNKTKTDAVLEASFTTSTGCTTCIESKQLMGDNIDVIGELQSYLVSALSEKEKLAGDLEKRKKDAENCKISIVDENDKSQDLNLKKRENKADYLQCKIDKIENDDDKNEKEQFAEFQKLMLDPEIKQMILSQDPKDAEFAERLTEMTSGNSYIENYLAGISTVREQNAYIIEQATILADRNNRNPMEVAQAQSGLNNMQMLLGSSQYPTAVRNSGSAAAFSAYRSALTQNVRTAIQNPDRLIYTENIASEILCSSEFSRGCRADLGWDSLPRISIAGSDSIEFNSGSGNRLYDPNSLNGGRGGRTQGQNFNNTRPGAGFQQQNRAPMYAPNGVQNAPSPYPYSYNPNQQNNMQFQQPGMQRPGFQQPGQNFAQGGTRGQ